MQRRPEIRLETHAICLFLEFVARARFNIAELSEEFAAQETHRAQQMKLLSHMASMSSLLHFLPAPLRPFVGKSLSPTPSDLHQRVCAVTRAGTLQRNMGLAVIHSLKAKERGIAEPSPKIQFIDRMLGKFLTRRRGASMEAEPSSHPVSRRAMGGSPDLQNAGFYRNVSSLYLSNDVVKLARRKVAKPSERFRHPGNHEVLKALKLGLRVSTDDQRFAIRELMEAHEKVTRD